VNSTAKTAVFWVAVFGSAVLLWMLFQKGTQGQKEQELSFSQFQSYVDDGKIAEVTVNGQEVRGKLTDGKTVFHTTAPDKYADMYKPLHDKGVNVTVKDLAAGTWSTWITTLGPFLLLAAFWFFMIRQMQMGGNKAMSFGKSRARLLHAAEKDHVQRRGWRG